MMAMMHKKVGKKDFPLHLLPYIAHLKKKEKRRLLERSIFTKQDVVVVILCSSFLELMWRIPFGVCLCFFYCLLLKGESYGGSAHAEAQKLLLHICASANTTTSTGKFGQFAKI